MLSFGSSNAGRLGFRSAGQLWAWVVDAAKVSTLTIAAQQTVR
jgi:hypothetical protein